MSYGYLTNSNNDRRELEKDEYPDLKNDLGSFDTATITDSDFIFYEKVRYGDSGGSKYKLVKKGEFNVKLGFTAGSCRVIPHNASSIVLYEHIDFCGIEKIYKYEQPDITPDFPVNKVGGASSAYIWETRPWKLYTQKYWKGPYVSGSPLQPGAHDDFRKYDANDKVQSIQPSF